MGDSTPIDVKVFTHEGSVPFEKVAGVFFINCETHGDSDKLCQHIEGGDINVVFVNTAAKNLVAVEIREASVAVA